ncbi:MAG: uncharacterized protein JWQ53_3099 [Klenkia sp.]|nr:uncharacterized protein [Klenkia sp.]
MNRAELLAARVRAQQLDRTGGTVADTAVLDLGVQDSGPAGAARWALALRGVARPAEEELALVWSVRGAPHVYRRADLPGVAAATAPWSDADAAKRVFDAAKPLKAAGLGVLGALDVVADAMRRIVTGPTVKGELSSGLTAALPAPFLRRCRPCGATHVYEQPFRLAALRAGLELEPGTSPPVLRPVPGLAPAADVPDRLDVVRAHLRSFGPSTPAMVAAYLDAPVREVRAHWPADAEEVDVAGETRWVLDLPSTDPVRGTWLLAPFDPFLQVRDRELLVPDPDRRKELFPVLGRPGAVLVDGEVAGVWRPRSSRGRLALAVTPWRAFTAAEREAVEDRAARLAAARGSTPGGVTHAPTG